MGIKVWHWGSLCLASLVVLELVLRFGIGLGQPPIVLLEDPDGIEYRLKPDAQYQRWGNLIAINRHGLRGPDFVLTLATDTRRVLLVGDSVVYGNHFLDQSEIIGTQLMDVCGGLEVATIAASSWGPVNQLAFLERFGLYGASDAVIVLSSHDLWDVPTARHEVIPYRTTPSIGALGDAVEAALERLKRRFLPPKDTTPDRLVRRARTVAALEGMMGRMVEAGMTGQLYLHPVIGDDPAEEEAFAQFRALAATYGFAIHEMHGVLRSADYQDRIHPTASGAKAYALHMANTLGC